MRKPKPQSTPETSWDAAQQSTVDMVQVLLSKQTRGLDSAAPIHGVIVGHLRAMSDAGQLDIAIPALGIESLPATAACALDALTAGEPVALMFQGGDTSKPLVIGPLHGVAAVAQPDSVQTAPLQVQADQERVVIQAEQEIELRCGDAAIILTRDGRILLRGAYISSHASATQRIRGGSVQIN
jgi:Domain of unknown function (DUF6484)